MGNLSLFMNEYNPRTFTLEDEEDSSSAFVCNIVANPPQIWWNWYIVAKVVANDT